MRCAILTLPALALLAGGCAPESSAKTSNPAEKSLAHAPAPPPGECVGKVIATMDSGGYTYVQVDTGSEQIWAAGPQAKIAAGQVVRISKAMPMPNFRSETLGRTFDVVYFVASLTGEAGGAPAHAPEPHEAMPPGKSAAVAPQGLDFSGIVKPADGHTVAELYAGKDELGGKEVTLRGKVVKFNARIMGTNWFHLQDGSGSDDAKNRDLTVTTDATLSVGDLVLVKGKVTLSKDFGFGYQYDVLIEGAAVTVEAPADTPKK